MDLSVTYASQKISKIRWQPIVSSLEKPYLFATGSIEDEKNVVSLWDTSHLRVNNPVVDDEDEDSDDFDLELDTPKQLSTYTIGADVSTLSFIQSNGIIAGTTSGNVTYLEIDDNKQLVESFSWSNLHSIRGGCSDVDANLPDIACVGDDGSIHIIHIGAKTPLHTITEADSSAITCVRWLSTNEICTCNSTGQLRMWDVRESTKKPTRVMITNETPLALYSIDRHPSQAHMIATGGADGCVTFFDIREEKAAVAKLQLHEYDVWDICFNNSAPDHMFTCSGDGSVRKLDTSSNIRMLALDCLSGTNSGTSSSDTGPGGSPVQITEVLSQDDCGFSVNSIDVCGTSVLAATDSEAIYLINDDPLI